MSIAVNRTVETCHCNSVASGSEGKFEQCLFLYCLFDEVRIERGEFS